MTTKEKLITSKLNLLGLASYLGNVSERAVASRSVLGGLHHDYRWSRVT